MLLTILIFSNNFKILVLYSKDQFDVKLMYFFNGRFKVLFNSIKKLKIEGLEIYVC